MSEHEEKGHSSHGGGHGGGHGGHGGGAHEEHEGAPEWLISFADNVALMMGFFVVLLAMNMKPATASGSGEGGQPTDEMLDWAIAIREAFNNPVDPESNNPAEAQLVERIRERQGTRPRGSGKKADAGVGNSNQTPIEPIGPPRHAALQGVLLFGHEETELSDAGKREVAEMAVKLRGLRIALEVRGYCSRREAFGRPDRGMSLGQARAAAVAGALAESGLDWQYLRVVAYPGDVGDGASEFSEHQHQARQRVEIVETGQTAGH